MNKNSELKNIAYKLIRINEKYRFFNSNYSFNDNTIPFFKHNMIIENLKNRILYSNGASFLITGLRGVGKSTLVKKVLHELNNNSIFSLPVYINLSKKIEYKDLLFETVRRLYESIIDRKVMDKISTSIANDIVVSYSRTSMSISNSNTVKGEIEFSTENNPLLTNILLKNRITQQAAEEASFLAYSANDVEHDLIRIIELLNSDKHLKIKTVIVFDELDKLTTTKSGIDYFEDILSKLKNIICSIEAISIFIGGLDLYQKWNDDTAKINSLYDSIFSWHQYIPSIWNSTDLLFELFPDKEYTYEKISEEFQFLCVEKYTNIIKPSFNDFLIYVNFKSKGIPRKIYSEFNNFILWNNGKPYFRISEIVADEIYAYSEIWKKISLIFEDRLYKTVIEMDLTYITCFNLIEFFFKHSNQKFNFEQIQKTLLYDDSTLPSMYIEQIISELMEKFIARHIISKTAEGEFIVTDLTIKQDENMAVKDKAILQKSFDKEKFDFEIPNKEKDVEKSFKRKILRYKSEEMTSFWEPFKANELILENSLMYIYSVVRKSDNSIYNAILYKNKQDQKMQSKNCLYSKTEYRFKSKYLLDTIDLFLGPRIQTSLRKIYDGYILAHFINAGIKTKYIILIIEQLINFIIELKGLNYFNANIKASNIMINKYLNVKILDIRSLIEIGSKGNPISSPGYAAPEMYTDSFDYRSDIYSIGVLLWEMINRKCIDKISFERHIEFQFLERPRHCSRRLWKIILKATRNNPDERYQTAEDFLWDIHMCKESIFNNWHVGENICEGTVTTLPSNGFDNIPTLYFDSSLYIPRAGNISGETSILSPLDYETTFLSADIKAKKSYLIRTATNELIFINKPVFKIGKSKERTDLCISDNSSISRHHASIITIADKYYLVDNDSVNHTYLNGEQLKLKEEKALKSGDIIKLANEEFVFRQD